MAAAPDLDAVGEEPLGDDYDAFFAEDGGGAVASTARATSSPSEPASSGSVAGDGIKVFTMNDGDSDSECMAAGSPDQAYRDLLPPEAPEPPSSFTSEDLALREALIEFYFSRRAENLAKVNAFVEQYRGRRVTHLWAQLGVKYNLPAVDVVKVLAQTLYLASPFEHSDDNEACELQSCLEELQAESLAAPVFSGGETEEDPSPGNGASALAGREQMEHLVNRSMEANFCNGSDRLLRLLCFRGLPAQSSLRTLTWKILIGYLPMAQQSEWDVILAEKRALYATYKNGLLVVTSNHKLEVKVERGRLTKALDLLQQIQRDVDRTQQQTEFFRKPATRCALNVLLFVYGQINPTIRYVQGMNEIAAIIYYVMSVACDPDLAEADAFWCFTEIMTHIKSGFVEELELGPGSKKDPHSAVNCVERLLKLYDPEVSKHLQKHGSPQLVLTYKWCTLLFAQDLQLPDAVRLWDSFIADPRRFEVVIHMSLAAILSCRDSLLSIDDPFGLAEVLRSAPRHLEFDELLRWAWAICSLERRTLLPVFPLKSAKEVAEELSHSAAEWAQTAAGKVQVVGSEVTRSLRQKVAPSVKERASQAGAVAVGAAQDSAQVVQTWLQETAPKRQEAYEKAQTTFGSFWSTLRQASSTAVSKTQEIASEYGRREGHESWRDSTSSDVKEKAEKDAP